MISTIDAAWGRALTARATRPTREEAFEWVLRYPFALAYLKSALASILGSDDWKDVTAYGWADHALHLWLVDLEIDALR